MAQQIQKLRKKLQKAGYGNISCSEFGSSVRLEGQMADWKEIVKVGRAAAKFGFKGVVNDIALEGFTAPAIRAPKIRDGKYEGTAPDVLIIGGGVVGCSIARELARYRMDILLLEKEDDVAMHASSRNDGMIHPGIASHPGTLRGEMNVKGNAMYTQICKDLSVPFARYSNVILYSSKLVGVGGWYAVMKPRAKAFGIPVEWLNRKQLEEKEPNITDEAIGAFECPTSGVLSPYKLTVALAENAIENGAQVALNTIVEGMEVTHGKITSVHTNRGTLHPRFVINAAGVFADLVADMAGDRFFSIHPRKGECAILDKKKGPLSQRSMGLIGLSAAMSDTKGGGIMRTIDQNVLVGPDAYEQPLREDFSTHRENMDALLKKNLPLIKGFGRADVITYFAGIRAATYEEEFVIEASERVGNLVHAAGIQSPGLASAPAIAERIAEITVDLMRRDAPVQKNTGFHPVRRVDPVLSKMTTEEKQELIQKNPDYGVVVCRCESISKGEIRDALHRPLPAQSIDAIKRRIRPGMGRCQGGFCMPLVSQIITEEAGIPLAQVTKNGAGAELLFPVQAQEGNTHDE